MVSFSYSHALFPHLQAVLKNLKRLQVLQVSDQPLISRFTPKALFIDRSRLYRKPLFPPSNLKPCFLQVLATTSGPPRLIPAATATLDAKWVQATMTSPPRRTKETSGPSTFSHRAAVLNLSMNPSPVEPLWMLNLSVVCLHPIKLSLQ